MQDTHTDPLFDPGPATHRLIPPREIIWDRHAVRKLLLDECMMGGYYSSVEEIEMDVSAICSVLHDRREIASAKEPF